MLENNPFFSLRETLVILDHRVRKGRQELMGLLGYQDYPDPQDPLGQAMDLDLR